MALHNPGPYHLVHQTAIEKNIHGVSVSVYPFSRDSRRNKVSGSSPAMPPDVIAAPVRITRLPLTGGIIMGALPTPPAARAGWMAAPAFIDRGGNIFGAALLPFAFHPFPFNPFPCYPFGLNPFPAVLITLITALPATINLRRFRFGLIYPLTLFPFGFTTIALLTAALGLLLGLSIPLGLLLRLSIALGLFTDLSLPIGRFPFLFRRLDLWRLPPIAVNPFPRFPFGLNPFSILRFTFRLNPFPALAISFFRVPAPVFVRVNPVSLLDVPVAIRDPMVGNNMGITLEISRAMWGLTIFPRGGPVTINDPPPVLGRVKPAAMTYSPTIMANESRPSLHIHMDIMTMPIEPAPGAEGESEIKGGPIGNADSDSYPRRPPVLGRICGIPPWAINI
jgi:hypothetical protein